MRWHKDKMNLEVGDKVVLDEGFNNSSEVEIIALSSLKMFATVKSGDSIWDVMTYRLSKIKQQ